MFNEGKIWNWDSTTVEQRIYELGSQNHADDDMLGSQLDELGSQSGDELTKANFDDTPIRERDPLIRYIDELT